jgi:hypothetical protein
VHARLDGGRACNRASTTRKTNRGALNRLKGALLDRLFDPLDGLSERVPERVDHLVPWSFQFQSHRQSHAWPHGQMIPILPIHEPVVLEIQAEINETQSTIIKTLDSGHEAELADQTREA